uniref:Transcription cofactor HES-6 n=1 Tax=Latimeria chalumnae TaxID=7897 RepID=M3XHN4_LATCH
MLQAGKTNVWGSVFQTRKPLVEKKRRARINESLHELRLILADADIQTKMENAEVLELTVKRVQNILRNRDLESDKLNREASERFAAGYIQCMHEVHTFVSNCPGIDSTIAAELLNHLLESMPLNEGSFQDLLLDLMSDSATSSGGTWSGAEGACHSLLSPGAGSLLPSPTALSPALSSVASEETCSDLEDTDSEQSHFSQDPLDNSRTQSLWPATYSKSMWRPW